MWNKFLNPSIFIALVFLLLISCNSDEQKVEQSKKTGTSQELAKDSFAYYENLLKSDSLNNELRLALSANYYSVKMFDKAIEHLSIVCSTDKKNKEAFAMLGNVYYDTEQFEKAIEFYEQAVNLDPKNLNVRCDLATCYLNIKKYDKALDLLKKNISIDNNHIQSHHNLSVLYTQMGKTKEADQEMKIFNKLSGK